MVAAAVLTSRVGRWLEADPSDWRPFTLEQLDERWQRGQRALADELHALHLVAPTAGHYIHQDDPRLVTDAIRSVVQELQPV